MSVIEWTYQQLLATLSKSELYASDKIMGPLLFNLALSTATYVVKGVRHQVNA